MCVSVQRHFSMSVFAPGVGVVTLVEGLVSVVCSSVVVFSERLRKVCLMHNYMTSVRITVAVTYTCICEYL